MKTALFSLFALSLLLAPAVAAQGRGGPPERAGRMMERIADHLELSEADAEILMQKMQAHRESTAPLMDELRGARASLEDQVNAETFDEAAIRDRGAEVAQLETDLAVSRALYQQELRELLTDEQWGQFKEMRQRRERGAMSHGRRGGSGRPPGGQKPGR